MVKDFLAYKAQATELKQVSDLAYGKLVLAQAAALAGQQLHTEVSTLVWDGLQVLGQRDLSVRAAREARYKNFMTSQLHS